MIKVIVSSKTIENFKAQILSNFYDKKGKDKIFKKNEKNNKWTISLLEINKLLKDKLKSYPKEIDLEKLITLDYKGLCGLKDFIDNNKDLTELTETQKDYFYTLYKRKVGWPAQ